MYLWWGHGDAHPSPRLVSSASQSCFMPFPDHRAGERGSCYTCFAKSSKFLRR